MTSFVDPSYRDAARFSSVVVVTFGMGLDERQAAEDSAVDSFKSHNVRALRGMDVIPPTRNLSGAQMAELIRAANVETVLVLSVGQKGETQTYIPPTYVPGSTYGTVNSIGNTAYLNIYQTPGYTIGGYSISKPRANYSATLYDVRTGSEIWTADALTKGNAFADYKLLAHSVAAKAVSTLLADGLFGTQPASEPD